MAAIAASICVFRPLFFHSSLKEVDEKKPFLSPSFQERPLPKRAKWLLWEEVDREQLHGEPSATLAVIH